MAHPVSDPMTSMVRAVGVFLVAGSLSACGHLAGPVALGEVLDFELSDLAGETIRLKEHRGRVVLVEFWAPWCRPCADELPRLSDLYTRLHAEGLEVMAVAARSSRDEVEAFLEDRTLPFPTPLDFDADVMRRLGLREIPSWVLIDAYGRVVHVHEAGPEDAFWQLEWVVRRGLGQPVGAPTTPGAGAHGRPVRPANSAVASGASSL